MKKKPFEEHILKHRDIVQTLLEKQYRIKILKAAGMILESIGRDRKVLLCGNGGSAADCQHFAGEMAGRFLRERKAVPFLSMTTNTSVLTAIGNDYSFEKVFSRQVEAFGRSGDMLIAFSTSGKSENIIRAAKTAKNKGLKIVSFTGKIPNPLAGISDLCLPVDSDYTPVIQEIHILLIHVICLLVEENL